MMNSKPIPGRRRFLQAFAALPLAGIAGAEMIKSEIAKVAIGRVTTFGSNDPGDAPAIPHTGSSVDYLKRLISDRNTLLAERRQSLVSSNAYECHNISILKSISPAASRSIILQRQADISLRDSANSLDRRIAEMRKDIDPLHLIGLVSDAE